MTLAKIPLPPIGTRVRILVDQRRGSYQWETLPGLNLSGLLGATAAVVEVAPCGRRVRVRLPVEPLGCRQVVALDTDEYEVLYA